LLDSPTEIAAKRKADGKKAMEAREYDKAREAFAEAFSHQQSFDLAGELGHAELKLRSYRDAAEHLAWCLAHAPPDEMPRLEATRKRLAEAKAQIGTVRLGANVRGAEIRADGKKIGTAPLPVEELYFEPGPHVFEAFHPDHEASRKDLTLDKGSAVPVDLVLTPRAGGKPLPPTPAPGRTDSDDGARTRYWALVGTGIGLTVAGLAAGVALTLVSNGKAAKGDELTNGVVQSGGRRACAATPADPRCQDVQDAFDARDAMAKGAVGAYAAAGAFAIATVVVAVVARPAPKPEAFMVEMAPVLGPSTAGAQLKINW
jgi:hypothetical protein